jgi:hypothetical protein
MTAARMPLRWLVIVLTQPGALLAALLLAPRIGGPAGHPSQPRAWHAAGGGTPRQTVYGVSARGVVARDAR